MGNLANIIVFRKEDELRKVLDCARLDGYAGDNVNDNGDGTKSTNYRSGDWFVKDSWGGGEPFAGIVEVFYDDTLCWSMIYYGQIEDTKRRNEVEDFLKEALSQPNSAFAVRGPNYYGSDKGESALRYICDNRLDGTLNIGNFEIEDKIASLDGNVLYRGMFKGGWKNIY